MTDRAYVSPFTDGYELPNHGRQSVYPNGSLVIENAHKLHDEGFYTCTAFNANDESHSGTLQIEVLSKWHTKLCSSSKPDMEEEGLFFYFLCSTRSFLKLSDGHTRVCAFFAEKTPLV